MKCEAKHGALKDYDKIFENLQAFFPWSLIIPNVMLQQSLPGKVIIFQSLVFLDFVFSGIVFIAESWWEDIASEYQYYYWRLFVLETVEIISDFSPHISCQENKTFWQLNQTINLPA